MLRIFMKNIKIIIFLIFILNNIQIKSDDSLKEKFFFQLYPSNDDEKPYIFHVYTPTKNFLTINSTEGKNCKIIEDKLVDEYPIIGLSSAHSFNDTFLIKTCFGPNKIVELIIKKNRSLFTKIIRYLFVFSLVNIGIIAYFYPTIPKESYYIVKRMMVSLFSYARKKIEDIHYNRNAVKVRETQNLDDLLNNL